MVMSDIVRCVYSLHTWASPYMATSSHKVISMGKSPYMGISESLRNSHPRFPVEICTINRRLERDIATPSRIAFQVLLSCQWAGVGHPEHGSVRDYIWPPRGKGNPNWLVPSCNNA